MKQWARKQLYPRTRIPVYKEVHADLVRIKGNKTWDDFFCETFGIKSRRRKR